MEFNKAQQETINTITGNVAVIAAAGSGKTTTLTYRIKNMVESHHILPSSILAITFSKKAKENIIDKLEKMNIKCVNVETFHSLALKVIQAKYGSTYTVWTKQWEKEKVVTDICTSLSLCSKDDVPYNEICSFIALQKNKMVKYDNELYYPEHLEFSKRDMKQIYQMYENYKEKNHYIEFDDFLNMANDIFSNDSTILKHFQDSYHYILVDEFQDVSLSQSLFLQYINTKNTMIVGDPLQAIYSFRGGDSKFIMNFDTTYDDVKVINLNTNYRCSADIIKTANKLAYTLPESKDKNYVESIPFNPSYKKPELRHFEDEYSEAAWISKYISKLKANGYKYNDIAILARTNAQLQKCETALYDRDIKYEIVDGKCFSELPEIKLLISYLRLSIHENDNEAFEYLYNKPNRWLDKKFLEEVKKNARFRNLSLYNSMFTIDRRNWRFKNGIDEIMEIINHLQNVRYSHVGELINYLRSRLNIDQYVTKGKQSDDGGFSEQIENMDSFESLCSKYKSIEEMLKYLENINKEINMSSQSKVKLLTIHKSKGMEYPVVFIIGCNDGLLPHKRNKDSDDEKRLLYVAMTRAEKELYMSYSDMYNEKLMRVSPFMNDIATTIKVVKKNN